ncbi:hypothetical protein D3C79_1088010 [compost metagenome]
MQEAHVFDIFHHLLRLGIRTIHLVDRFACKLLSSLIIDLVPVQMINTREFEEQLILRFAQHGCFGLRSHDWDVA